MTRYEYLSVQVQYIVPVRVRYEYLYLRPVPVRTNLTVGGRTAISSNRSADVMMSWWCISNHHIRTSSFERTGSMEPSSTPPSLSKLQPPKPVTRRAISQPNTFDHGRSHGRGRDDGLNLAATAPRGNPLTLTRGQSLFSALGPSRDSATTGARHGEDKQISESSALSICCALTCVVSMRRITNSIIAHCFCSYYLTYQASADFHYWNRNALLRCLIFSARIPQMYSHYLAMALELAVMVWLETVKMEGIS